MRSALLVVLLGFLAAASHTQPCAPAKSAKPSAVSAHPSTAHPSKDDRAHLVLLYTASASGQVRSCNCTKFRFGGYGRELTLLTSIRSECSNVVLIEGGDMCGDGGFQAGLKADVAAKAMGLLGYQAVIPGENEIGAGDTGSMGHFVRESAPLVCANLFQPGTDKPAFLPYKIVKTSGGLKVGIIGLFEPTLLDALSSGRINRSVQDPVVCLRQAIKSVRGKSDFVVVVYHGGVGQAAKLSAVKGIDVLLCTHRSHSKVLFPPKTTNMIEASVKKQGTVTLIDSETKENWCLGRIDIGLSSKHTVKSARHALFYLDRRYPEDARMVKVYDAYNAKVRSAVINSAGAFRKSEEALLMKRGLNLVDMRKRLHKSRFVTAEACKSCHAQAYESWTVSRHAHAISTLEKSNQEFDPECVSCHATGVIAAKGFVNMKETPELGNVQCEACHGSGTEHVKSPSKGYGMAGEETCRSCHTDERTPDFDFEQAWAKVKH